MFAPNSLVEPDCQNIEIPPHRSVNRQKYSDLDMLTIISANQSENPEPFYELIKLR